MYPELYTLTFGTTDIPITTFGVALTLAFFLFYWMLQKLGKRYKINTSFFTVNLLSFFLTTFFVSRLAHVILYAGLPTKSAFSLEFPILSFFLMSDFYFSAGGAILAFFWLFSLYMRQREKGDRENVLDITVIAWVFASMIAYLGAFLWGQVYGVRSNGVFAVDYINNPILAEFPRFPLALVYVLCILIIFSLIYIIRKVRPERWLAAWTGALLWGIMWFIGEWWNDASSDNVSYLFGLLSHWKIVNFNQLIALGLIVWWSWRLAHIIPSPVSEWIVKKWDRLAAKNERILIKTEKNFEKIKIHSQRLFKKISVHISHIYKNIKNR